MTDEDDARLCRWREGADKVLESDSEGEKRAPPRTQLWFPPYTGEVQLSAASPPINLHPHPLLSLRASPPVPVLGLLNLEGNQKQERESGTAITLPT